MTTHEQHLYDEFLDAAHDCMQRARNGATELQPNEIPSAQRKSDAQAALALIQAAKTLAGTGRRA